MPGAIETIVNAISNDLVAYLATASLPPLTPLQDGSAGKIEIGPQHLNEHYAPPRVVFIPVTNKLQPRNAANPVSSSSTTKQINLDRIVATEWLTFEVHVWNAADTPDGDVQDYDATRDLYHQVLVSIANVIGPLFGGEKKGVVRVSDVEWNDDDAKTTRLGREAVFTVGFSTPIHRTTLASAPVGTTGSTSVGDETQVDTVIDPT